MRYLPVHWFEGMFLRPHQFQAADRHWEECLATSGRWDNPYNYGIQHIDLSPEGAGQLSSPGRRPAGPNAGRNAVLSRGRSATRSSRPETGFRIDVGSDGDAGDSQVRAGTGECGTRVRSRCDPAVRCHRHANAGRLDRRQRSAGGSAGPLGADHAFDAGHAGFRNAAVGSDQAFGRGRGHSPARRRLLSAAADGFCLVAAGDRYDSGDLRHHRREDRRAGRAGH